MIEGGRVYVVNDYEWALTLERSGLDGDAVARRAAAVIVTQGEHGSLIRRGSAWSRSRSVAAERVVDPTGAATRTAPACSTASCAALPLEHAARIGSLLGALQVACPGTQNLDARPRRVPRALRARVRNAALNESPGQPRLRFRDLGWWGLAAFLPVPWMTIYHLGGFGISPAGEALFAGLAILGAAFLLSWAVELAERDIPQALALLVLALVCACCPSTPSISTSRGRPAEEPEYAHYAIANMTGANRLLIGVGWAAVVLIACPSARASELSHSTRTIARDRATSCCATALLLPDPAQRHARRSSTRSCC